jgi:hypothetical protein
MHHYLGHIAYQNTGIQTHITVIKLNEYCRSQQS